MSYSDQAVLSSSLHQLWAITYGSTLETRIRYTPSDVFETFPRPEPTERLEEVGRTLDEERREIMLRRDLGLTKLYNLVNDPDVGPVTRTSTGCATSTSSSTTRRWTRTAGTDIDPTTAFTPTGRWSAGRSARLPAVEILDRLLEENHRRASACEHPKEATQTAAQALDEARTTTAVRLTEVASQRASSVEQRPSAAGLGRLALDRCGVTGSSASLAGSPMVLLSSRSRISTRAAGLTVHRSTCR